MDALQQLQQMAAQQGFAKLSTDVELPVDTTSAEIRLTHVDVGVEYKDGKPTEKIKTQQHLDEETGEVSTVVRVKCTVQFTQGGAVAPAKLNSLWVDVETATSLVQCVSKQARVKLINPRVVPYIETYQKKDSNFVGEKPAAKFVVDGVELA